MSDEKMVVLSELCSNETAAVPSSIKARCAGYGEPVWISPSSLEMPYDEAWCMGCARESGLLEELASRPAKVVVPPRQGDELREAGLPPVTLKEAAEVVEKLARNAVMAVFAFPNGLVAVMGYDGQQIAELQGRFDEVRDRVWAAADEETEFTGWPGVPDGTRGKT